VCVASVTQHAKRMRHIMLSPVECLTLPYFSTFSHKRRDFRKEIKVTEHKMCALIFSTNFVWYISHCKNNSVRYNKYHICTTYRSPCIVTFILSHFNPELFRNIFRKIPKCHVSWNSAQWEPSCSMQTDRQTQKTKLTVTFRDFVNAPKIVSKGHAASISFLRWRQQVPAKYCYPSTNTKSCHIPEAISWET
jgi:hypothetical protein